MLTFGAWWPRSTRQKRLRPELRAAVVARAPVVDHGRIEGRLVELVLDEHPPVRRAAPRRSRAGSRGSARRRGGSATWPGKLPPSPIQTVQRPASRASGRSRCTRGCARPPAAAPPGRCASGCRTCRRASGPAGPGRCSSSSRRRPRPSAPRVRLQLRRVRRPCPRGCAARPAASRRTSCWIAAQSSSFSKMLRGSPGPGKAREARAAGADAPRRAPRPGRPRPAR